MKYKRRQDAAPQAGEEAVTNLQPALALAEAIAPRVHGLRYQR
ncbi:hypothetical protein [Streptomyces sp. NBC_01431]|nr:hypothetical protein [Streptomyces sp. NBC_01431]